MVRKLLLPALAILLLGGCVSTGYGYRSAPRGDYYYGHPTTDYRYHGDFRYSSGGYGYWPHRGYSNWYSPYRYPGYYYGYPGYRPPIVVHPRPDNGHDRPNQDRDRAPWRDLDRIRQDRTPTVERRPLSTAPRPAVQRPASPAPRPPVNRGGNDRGSRMGQAIRKAGGESRRVVE